MPGPMSLPGDGWVCLVPGPFQEVAMPGLGSLPGGLCPGGGRLVRLGVGEYNMGQVYQTEGGGWIYQG